MEPFSSWRRRKRNEMFLSLVKPRPGMKILDVGGQPQIWDSIEIPLKITCLNLPGVAATHHPTHHEITYVEGDGCSMPQYEEGEFDLVFSNSVIEHVGDIRHREQFSQEIRRICKSYWIQTPSKYFPIEAHCGMPFWWFYPRKVKTFFITRWKRKLPAWTEMVETTDFVTRKELARLFPDGVLKREWFIFPKSTIAYHVDLPNHSG